MVSFLRCRVPLLLHPCPSARPGVASAMEAPDAARRGSARGSTRSVETCGGGGTCRDALRARGAEPLSKQIKNGRMGGSAAEPIRQPRDRLKEQPQERQHSDALPCGHGRAGRGIDCPGEGSYLNLRERSKPEGPRDLSAHFTRASGRRKADAPARSDLSSNAIFRRPCRGSTSRRDPSCRIESNGLAAMTRSTSCVTRRSLAL